jgi:hypothetical protein
MLTYIELRPFLASLVFLNILYQDNDYHDKS